MEKLPPDIIRCVASCFRVTASRTVHESSFGTPRPEYRTLAAMSQVSKAFHDMSVPELYRVLDLRFKKSKVLRLLINTLINKELDVAKHVHEIIFSFWDVTSKERNRYARPRELLGGQLGQVMIAWMRFNAPYSFGLRLTKKSWRTETDLERAFILALCPNLRICIIVAPRDWNRSLVMEVLRKVRGRKDSTLQELSVAFPFSNNEIESDIRRSALWKDTPITRLEVLDSGPLCCEIEGETEDEFAPVPYFVQIRSIQITHGDIVPDGLYNLLGFCPQVEELILGSGDVYSHYCCIGDVLRLRGGNLKRLTLVHVVEECSLHQNAHYRSIGDLSTLGKLEQLSISGRILFGLTPALDEPKEMNCLPLPRCLPVSLTKLRIIGPNLNERVSWEQQIRWLLDDGRFVNLTTIQLHPCESESLELSLFEPDPV